MQFAKDRAAMGMWLIRIAAALWLDLGFPESM